MKRVMSLLIAAFGFISTPIHAQQVNIVWMADPHDSIGTALATTVRERLASSSILNLIYDENASTIKATFNTLSSGSYAGSNNFTIYALVITFHLRGEGFDRYVTQYVGTCGIDRIANCAIDIYAAIDQAAEAIRQAAARSN